MERKSHVYCKHILWQIIQKRICIIPRFVICKIRQKPTLYSFSYLFICHISIVRLLLGRQLRLWWRGLGGPGGGIRLRWCTPSLNRLWWWLSPGLVGLLWLLLLVAWIAALTAGLAEWDVTAHAWLLLLPNTTPLLC